MSDSAKNEQGGQRALFVTTVPVTLRAFLLPLAEALRAQGWHVDALTGLPRGPQDGTLSSGEDISGGGRPDTDEPPAWEQAFDAIHTIGWSRSLRSFLRYRRLARELRELVSTGAYRVVHTHTPIASLITRLALRKIQGTRVIYTAHGFHFFRGQHKWLQGWLFRRAERLCTRFTDVLVVMNDEDEAAAQRLVAGTGRCKVARIDGVGIRMEDYTPAVLGTGREEKLRTEYALPEGSFVVGMIAELNDNKRHRLALDAARLLQQSHPRLHWLFIGSGSSERLLRVRVGAERLPVTFTGQIDAALLRELFALIDLGLLVSEREGLPRSLMELSAAGIPVAGTRTRGIIDEVRDERALAVSCHGGAIAEVVARIADDPALAAELAMEQRAYALQRYTLDVVLPQYLALYDAADEVPGGTL